MHIIIVNEMLYNITESQSLNDLKDRLNIFLEKQVNLINLDKSVIQNLIVSQMSQNNGKIERINTYPPKFDVFIQEYIVWYLFDQKQGRNRYAESVIVHELLHCKDIYNTALTTDLNVIEKDSHNLKELYLNLGYHQWSEYYAHYYSAKIHESEIITLKTDIKSFYDSICKFREEILFDDTNNHFLLYENVLHPFVKTLVILLANVNSIGNESHAAELLKYGSINSYIKDYIDKISDILTGYLDSYPDCISNEKFIELGRTLLTI